MARILLIQRDVDARRAIATRLAGSRARHVVALASTVAEALSLARERRHDVVVLDASVAGAESIAACRALRALQTMAQSRIIVVGDEADDPRALVDREGGADGALVEPYSLAALERALDATVEVPARSKDVGFESELLRIDPGERQVFVEGEELELTRLETDLLLFLSSPSRVDRVQSRETLLAEVWGIDAAVDTRTIDTHVRRLRAKLGRARTHVRSVRRSGYLFTADPGTALGQSGRRRNDSAT